MVGICWNFVFSMAKNVALHTKNSIIMNITRTLLSHKLKIIAFFQSPMVMRARSMWFHFWWTLPPSSPLHSLMTPCLQASVYFSLSYRTFYKCIKHWPSFRLNWQVLNKALLILFHCQFQQIRRDLSTFPTYVSNRSQVLSSSQFSINPPLTTSQLHTSSSQVIINLGKLFKMLISILDQSCITSVNFIAVFFFSQ